MFLTSVDDVPDLTDTRRSQRNGLCGAAVPGTLSMVTGLHTGAVTVVVEWQNSEPDVAAGWEDIVEVSFQPLDRDVMLSSFEDTFEVELPALEPLRVRFSATGMDAGRLMDTTEDDEIAPDTYLLQLWPAAPRPDAVIRQGSAAAQYWHEHARSIPF
jgi:hypothetical protein